MSSLSRKERKRLSDRIAQREHRKRQKSYVEDLEAQLALARDGGESEMAALLAENRRLRQEVAQLRDVCSSVDVLMAKVKTITPTTPIAAAADTEAEIEAHTPASIDMNGFLDMNITQPLQHHPLEALDLHNDPPDMYPLEDHSGINENPPVLTDIPADLSHDCLSWSSALQSLPNPSPEATSSYTHNPKLSFSNTTHDFMGMPATSFLPHQVLPLNNYPPLPSDLLIHWIRDRAANQLNPPRPPTLDDFFSETPSNRLATDLRVLLEPMKGKSTKDLLALYWIVYLLIKWHSSQEHDSYYALPIWLRPTQMQLTIRHPIALDLMPWPRLRNYMIISCLMDTSESYALMMAIGDNLDIDIQLTGFPLAEASSTIHESICDLRNWKLSQAILETHPILAELCDPSIQSCN